LPELRPLLGAALLGVLFLLDDVDDEDGDADEDPLLGAVGVRDAEGGRCGAAGREDSMRDGGDRPTLGEGRLDGVP